MASLICDVVAFVSLCISASSAAALPPFSPPLNASQSLTAACNQTAVPDLCIKHLVNFNESQAADVHSLTGLMVRAAAVYAKDATMFVQRRNSVSDPENGECLNDCLETMEDAIQQLDDTTKAVDLRAFEDVEDWVAAAVADAATCNGSCKGADGKPQIKELYDMTTEFTELCKIIMDLSKLDAQGKQ